MRTHRACIRGAIVILCAIASLGLVQRTEANPLFARQTGLNCSGCHTVYPELAPFGRQFKLAGYALGEREKVPLALMAVVSRNSINGNTDKSTGDKLFGKNNEFVAEAVSLFSGGKITDNAGAFIQWTYINVSTTDSQTFSGHSALDNTDLRLVKLFGSEEKPTLFGLTLHNNPTVQDVFNTISAWSFPYWSPSIAAPGRGTSTFLESGVRVAGIGGYAYLLDSLYLEATSYHTAKGALSVLRAGSPDNQRVSLNGANPYWRIAYTFGSEHQNFTIGHFGSIATVEVPDSATAGDRFRDLGFDAQYQFFSRDDRHIVSAQAALIHEKTDWRSGFPNGSKDNPNSTLRSARAKVTYLFDRTYGITAGAFKVTGDADFARFGTTSGKPDTTGYIVELNYWPKFKFVWDPQMNVRYGFQYTGYTKFNGSHSNYDGTLRRAADNNTFFFYAWLMF
ncbi:cytochrome C [Cupriavidus sp. D39]|uniref:cytochrome C n=1 Tax=Cupriavidus sp. D39 TaxID=2997877 RepID=UPI002271D140|nr:cytochrome C [Cupriavidus sp. D39]MCY0853935.1 cytochrome C [Cupriavidus sp. D39]